MAVLVTAGRLLMLCVSVGALGAAACRIASRLTPKPDLRVIAAVTLGCFAAIAQALLLGLVGLGENGAALTIASLATWVVLSWRVAPPEGPSLLAQIAAGRRALKALDAAVLGAAVVGGVAALADLLWRPYTPYDGLMYHLSEPVLWLHNGHPGSLVAVNQQLPLQTYPRNTEVLLAWLLGLTHTLMIGTLLMFGLLAIAAFGLITALALLGVDRRIGALIAVAILSNPVGVLQLAGASTDLAALTWMVVAATLCLGAIKERALLPVAFIGAGLAVGTKASAAVPVVVMLVATLLLLRRSLWTGRVSLLVGAGLGTAIGGLWYVVNWVVYGAPLYPFSRIPDGRVLPLIITESGESFIRAPLSSLRAGTLHGYFHWFGGGSLLVASAIAAVLALPKLRADERRWLVVAVVAAVLALLAWSTVPFTGYPGVPGTSWFPLDGLRYLFPSLPIVTLPLALLTKTRGVVRQLAVAVLVVVIAANVWALRYWAPPYRPAAVYVLAGLIIGAVFGSWAVAIRHRPLAVKRWLRTPVVALATVLVAAAALTVPATGYLTRAAALTQPRAYDPFSIPTVVGWLDHQPGWVHGHQAVAAGPILDALLAGPTISHRLILVTQRTSCADVRQLQDTDWLVFNRPETATLKGHRVLTFDRSTCLRAVRPAFVGGRFLIYRPMSDAPRH